MEEDEYYKELYKERKEDIKSSSKKTPGKPTPARNPDDVLPVAKFFMCAAFLSAGRSDDPRTKVGACIVNQKKTIVAFGHNDLPFGCVKELQLADFKFDWNKRDLKDVKWPDTKYPYVCHAAINAILNKNAENLEGCTLYTTLFPGHEDVKLIIQSGIKKVVYYEKKYTTYTRIADGNLTLAGVITARYPADDSNPWTNPTMEEKSSTSSANNSSIIDTTYTGIADGNLTQAGVITARYPADDSNPWTKPTMEEKSSTSSANNSSNQCLAIANVKLFSKDDPEDKKGGDHEDKKGGDPEDKKGGDPEDKKGVNTDKDRDFFMAMALLTARRSEDPHRQVGACIVNQDGKIVGIGYNDMPYGVSGRSWGNFKGLTKDHVDYVKYHNVVHAEANAIMHKTCIDLKGCTIYVTLFPCNECTKLIIQSGIENIYFLEGEPQIPIVEGTQQRRRDKYTALSSRRLLEMAGYTLFPDSSTIHGRSKFCQKYVPFKETQIDFPVLKSPSEASDPMSTGSRQNLLEKFTTAT